MKSAEYDEYLFDSHMELYDVTPLAPFTWAGVVEQAKTLNIPALFLVNSDIGTLSCTPILYLYSSYAYASLYFLTHLRTVIRFFSIIPIFFPIKFSCVPCIPNNYILKNIHSRKIPCVPRKHLIRQNIRFVRKTKKAGSCMMLHI